MRQASNPWHKSPGIMLMTCLPTYYWLQALDESHVSLFVKVFWKSRVKSWMPLSAHLARSRKQLPPIPWELREWPTSPQIKWRGFFFLNLHRPWHFLAHQAPYHSLLAGTPPLAHMAMHSFGLPASSLTAVASSQTRWPHSLSRAVSVLSLPPDAIIDYHLPSWWKEDLRKSIPWFAVLLPLCIWKSNLSWQLILHPILGLHLYHSIA